MIEGPGNRFLLVLQLKLLLSANDSRCPILFLLKTFQIFRLGVLEPPRLPLVTPTWKFHISSIARYLNVLQICFLNLIFLDIKGASTSPPLHPNAPPDRECTTGYLAYERARQPRGFPELVRRTRRSCAWLHLVA